MPKLGAIGSLRSPTGAPNNFFPFQSAQKRERPSAQWGGGEKKSKNTGGEGDRGKTPGGGGGGKTPGGGGHRGGGGGGKHRGTGRPWEECKMTFRYGERSYAVMNTLNNADRTVGTLLSHELLGQRNLWEKRQKQPKSRDFWDGFLFVFLLFKSSFF